VPPAASPKTYGRRGVDTRVLPSDHPRSLRVASVPDFGRCLESADVVVAVGTRFGQNAGRSGPTSRLPVTPCPHVCSRVRDRAIPLSGGVAALPPAAGGSLVNIDISDTYITALGDRSSPVFLKCTFSGLVPKIPCMYSSGVFDPRVTGSVL